MSRRAPILADGRRLNHYRVDGFIASGGMGEVYLAWDTSLHRRVALKVLHAGSRPDAERVARFHFEARAASALQHPSIVTVYDQGISADADGNPVQYVVFEHVEGETLAERLQRRDPLPRLLEWMAQVIEGVGAAHDRGIVHRDLKPANIMISRQGWAKVLDFGVAKLHELRTTQGIGAPETEPDTLLGTPAYSAPEQITGGAVDARTDVFSIGCILQEILGGSSPFMRSSRAATIQAILNDDPSPMPDGAPAELRRIIRKCLAPRPEERYQSMKDLAIDLRTLGRELEGNRLKRRKRARVGILAATVAAASIVGGALIRKDDVSAAAAEPGQASPRATVERVTNNGRVSTAGLSPDGKFVAYVLDEDRGRSVWVKHLATGNSMRIVETTPMVAHGIRISSDNAWVYYAAAFHSDLNRMFIMRVPLLGGEPEKVVNEIEGAAISPDGRKIAFRRFDAEIRKGTLHLHDMETGVESELLSFDPPSGFWAVDWHPDGRLTFLRREGDSSSTSFMFLDPSTRALTTMEPNPIMREPLQGIRNARWLPDGSGVIVSARGAVEPSQLWYLPVPADSGAPRKITNDLSDYGDPTLSADGETLLAIRQEMTSNLFIVDVDEPRQPRALTSGIGNLYGTAGAPRWTPDGRIIFSSIASGRVLLNSIAAGGGTIARLSGEANSGNPAVSRDGSRIVFLSDRSGRAELWVSDADGGNARQVTRGGEIGPHTFFPDGRHVAFVSQGAQQRIWKISVDGGEAVRLTDRAANFPEISPDGKWLLCRYRAAEPGKPLWRTAVLPLDGSAPPAFYDVPRYGGGPRLRWHPDGESFSFLDWQEGVANVWLQDVKGGEPRQVTRFDAGKIFSYDWSPDGRSLVLAQGEVVGDAVVIRHFRVE